MELLTAQEDRYSIFPILQTASNFITHAAVFNFFFSCVKCMFLDHCRHKTLVWEFQYVVNLQFAFLSEKYNTSILEQIPWEGYSHLWLAVGWPDWPTCLQLQGFTFASIYG